MSFESTNYPGKYFAPCVDGAKSGVEANRICVLASDAFPAEDGSFKVTPGLSNSSLYSFQSLSNVRRSLRVSSWWG